MTIQYNIYSDHGAGGPVDYSAPVGVAAAPGFVVGPLAPSKTYTFAVRAFDASTGLEEANTDAVARVSLDATGALAPVSPNRVHAVTLGPTAGGGCRVTWAYAPDRGAGSPDRFLVTVAPAVAGSGAPVSAEVAYLAGGLGGTCVFPGPFAVSDYTASVAASAPGALPSAAVAATGRLGLPAGPFVMDPITVS